MVHILLLLPSAILLLFLLLFLVIPSAFCYSEIPSPFLFISLVYTYVFSVPFFFSAFHSREQEQSCKVRLKEAAAAPDVLELHQSFGGKDFHTECRRS